MDVYEWADRTINSAAASEMGFTALLAAKPYPVAATVRHGYDARLPVIRAFQTCALDVFKAALRDELPPAVLHLLLNETPESYGARYHRNLEDRHFTAPVFFRTDEVKPGRIIEINCPGSLWGELQLAFEFARWTGHPVDEPSPADRFADQLMGLLGEVPIVHNFLDGLASPAAARYFHERTRPRVRYWAIDRGITRGDCNFVRNPSFLSICTEDECSRRMAKAGRGVTYDLPPIALFDQKISVVLPFWSVTRDAFAGVVRGLFPFTTPLLPSGIELADGSRETIESFSRRPRSQRAYFAKYAGVNFTLGAGSRGVFRLRNMSGEACLDFLCRCLGGYERGAVWLLQEEEVQDDEVEYLARDGTTRKDTMRVKFSGYYGPGGCIGVLAMHRKHYKVHAQPDAVLSYVLPDDRGRNPT